MDNDRLQTLWYKEKSDRNRIKVLHLFNINIVENTKHILNFLIKKKQTEEMICESMKYL